MLPSHRTIWYLRFWWYSFLLETYGVHTIAFYWDAIPRRVRRCWRECYAYQSPSMLTHLEGPILKYDGQRQLATVYLDFETVSLFMWPLRIQNKNNEPQSLGLSSPEILLISTSMHWRLGQQDDNILLKFNGRLFCTFKAQRPVRKPVMYVSFHHRLVPCMYYDSSSATTGTFLRLKYEIDWSKTPLFPPGAVSSWMWNLGVLFHPHNHRTDQWRAE